MNFNDTKRRSTGTALQKKPPYYEEIDAVLGGKPTTIRSCLISSSGIGSNIPTDDSDSDTFDDEVPLEYPINATNIPISSSKKILAGSSRPLTGEQNESSLSNENVDNENSFGRENVGNEASCSTSTAKNNRSSFYFKKKKKKSNKKRARSDMLFDRLNNSMNSFMNVQSEADNDFLSNS